MTPKKAKTDAAEEPPKLTPYQGKRRCFGFFQCSKCNRQWSSGHSWANTNQDCRACLTRVYPKHQQPLLKRKKRESSRDDPLKAHAVELCGKCQKLGSSCVFFDCNKQTDKTPDNGEQSKKKKKRKRSKRKAVKNEALKK